MFDRPSMLIALIVSSYWTIVLLKLALVRVRHRKRGALVPKLAIERRIWPAWVIVITGWHAAPMFASVHSNVWWGLPSWATLPPFDGIRAIAAVLASALFAATLYCWYAMGRHWSVAVIPGELKTLVTTGPFRIVRHPIYSLSIQLMLCTLVVVPNAPMLVIALSHIGLMRLKVAIEEQALAAEFGAAWQSYTERTGRLIPIWAGAPVRSASELPAPKHLSLGRRQERDISPAFAAEAESE